MNSLQGCSGGLNHPHGDLFIPEDEDRETEEREREKPHGTSLFGTGHLSQERLGSNKKNKNLETETTRGWLRSVSTAIAAGLKSELEHIILFIQRQGSAAGQYCEPKAREWCG